MKNDISLVLMNIYSVFINYLRRHVFRLYAHIQNVFYKYYFKYNILLLLIIIIIIKYLERKPKVFFRKNIFEIDNAMKILVSLQFQKSKKKSRVVNGCRNPLASFSLRKVIFCKTQVLVKLYKKKI